MAESGTDGFDRSSPTFDSLGSTRDSQRLWRCGPLDGTVHKCKNLGRASKKKKMTRPIAEASCEQGWTSICPGLAPHAGVRFPGRADWWMGVQRAGAIRGKFVAAFSATAENQSTPQPLRPSTQQRSASTQETDSFRLCQQRCVNVIHTMVLASPPPSAGAVLPIADA